LEFLSVTALTVLLLETIPLQLVAMWLSLGLHASAVYTYDYYLFDFLQYE
jgi:hypothetical protein